MNSIGGTTYVQLNDINVNVLSDSSGIFIGPNNQWGWSSHYKETDIITLKGNNPRLFIDEPKILKKHC